MFCFLLPEVVFAEMDVASLFWILYLNNLFFKLFGLFLYALEHFYSLSPK